MDEITISEVVPLSEHIVPQQKLAWSKLGLEVQTRTWTERKGLPIIACMGRLPPKGLPFSGFCHTYKWIGI